MRSSPFDHILTVDVERWHDGVPGIGGRAEEDDSRFERNVNRVLELLGEYGARATFFWLGTAAKRFPNLVRAAGEAGHEIGCHGWGHEPIHTLGRNSFEEETRRAVDTISNISGERVISYRAPFFSLCRSTAWAFDVLDEIGIRYDSSVLKGWNWRYCYGDFTGVPEGCRLRELKVSTLGSASRGIPVGGAWFRVLPRRFVRQCLRRQEVRLEPGVIYFHPWELDPEHPVLFFSPLPWLCHYWRLSSTEGRLRWLLRDTGFKSIRDVCDGG